MAEFFDKHLPNRLQWLRGHKLWCEEHDQWLADSNKEPPNYLIESAFAGCMVACRLFLAFLGLGHQKGVRLCESQEWFGGHGNSHEVKVTDLGGRFVAIDSLTPVEQSLLASAFQGVSKAMAHLTWESGHTFAWSTLHDVVGLILRLLKENLYDIVDRQMPQ